MRQIPQQSKLSSVQIVVIAAVVAVIGVLGYVLYNNYQEKEASKPTPITNVAEAPAITTPTDLDKASVTIDDTELEQSNEDDLDKLESELSEF